MLKKLRDFWQREGRFTLTMVSITVMFGGIYFFTHGIQLSVWTKLLLGLVLSLLLILLISGVTIMSTQFRRKVKALESEGTSKKKESLLYELKSIFANVPSNHIWVLRNIWRSNPNTFEGYYEKEEGWRLFIPYLIHDEAKLVSLVPVQKDPYLIEINTRDNLLPLVDYRIKTWVAQYPGGGKPAINKAAIKYALRIKDRFAVENQLAHVALNQISSDYFCSKPIEGTEAVGLTEMNRKQLERLSKNATAVFNKEMDYFGIQGEISIQNIRPPKAIEAASSQISVAKLRESAAEHEATAMKKVIQGTGASPDVALITESITNVVRGFFGAKEEKPDGRNKSKSNKK